MTIPGLDRTGTAVTLDGETVRLVDVRVRRGRVRVRRQVEVPLGAEGLDAALSEIASQAGRSLFVATALPGGAHGLGVSHAPPLADDEDRWEWLDAQAAARERPGQVGAAGLVETERGAWAVGASADARAVQEWTDRLERAGLRVVRVGDGQLEAASAFAAQGEHPDATLVVAGTERVTRVRLEAGRPAEVGSGEWTDALAQAATAPGPLVVCGERAREAADELLAVYGRAATVAPVLADARGGPLGPEWAPVVGLALEEAYPGLRLLDVADPDRVAEARRDERAARAKQGVLVLAVLALVLLGTVRTGQVLVERELEQADEALLAQADDLFALERARTRVDRLRAQAGGGAGRTAVALAYQAVGRAMPDGVWLESLEVDADGALRLTAFSVDDLGAETAVAALAQSDRLAGVRLRYVERVQPAPGLPEGLVRFEVEARTD